MCPEPARAIMYSAFRRHASANAAARSWGSAASSRMRRRWARGT